MKETWTCWRTDKRKETEEGWPVSAKGPEMAGQMKLTTGLCCGSRELNDHCSECCLVRSHIASVCIYVCIYTFQRGMGVEEFKTLSTDVTKKLA